MIVLGAHGDASGPNPPQGVLIPGKLDWCWRGRTRDHRLGGIGCAADRPESDRAHRLACCRGGRDGGRVAAAAAATARCVSISAARRTTTAPSTPACRTSGSPSTAATTGSPVAGSCRVPERRCRRPAGTARAAPARRWSPTRATRTTTPGAPRRREPRRLVPAEASADHENDDGNWYSWECSSGNFDGSIQDFFKYVDEWTAQNPGLVWVPAGQAPPQPPVPPEILMASRPPGDGRLVQMPIVQLQPGRSGRSSGCRPGCGSTRRPGSPISVTASGGGPLGDGHRDARTGSACPACPAGSDVETACAGGGRPYAGGGGTDCPITFEPVLRWPAGPAVALPGLADLERHRRRARRWPGRRRSPGPRTRRSSCWRRRP